MHCTSGDVAQAFLPVRPRSGPDFRITIQQRPEGANNATKEEIQ
jgi:hypothetical protein